MKNKYFAAFLFGALVSVSTIFAQTTVKEWTVADKRADCPGTGVRKCLVVREGSDGDWAYFSDTIRGFVFRDGYTQVIRVSVVPRKAAPAEYRLAKALSSEKTDGRTFSEALAEMESRKSPVLAGRNWTLTAIGGKAVEMKDVTFRFDGGSNRFGVRICNQIGGRYEQDGTNLKLTSLISTQMACQEPLASTETSFQEVISKVDKVRINGEKLTMSADGTDVLEFVERVSLEGIRWAITEVGGEKVVTSGDVPYIQLKQLALNGFTGCNQVFGSYELKDKSLRFGDIGMTKLECTEEPLIKVEMAILDAIRRADRFEIRNGVLIISAGDLALMRLSAIAN